MLTLTIVVRPQRAELLCQRLLAAGQMTELVAEEVRGYGRQKGHLERYAGAEYHIDFLPKVRVTGLVEDAHLEAVIDQVNTTCRTGRIGDGKIFVSRVEWEQGI